jgi:hypothetical protein
MDLSYESIRKHDPEGVFLREVCKYLTLAGGFEKAIEVIDNYIKSFTQEYITNSNSTEIEKTVEEGQKIIENRNHLQIVLQHKINIIFLQYFSGDNTINILKKHKSKIYNTMCEIFEVNSRYVAGLSDQWVALNALMGNSTSIEIDLKNIKTQGQPTAGDQQKLGKLYPVSLLIEGNYKKSYVYSKSQLRRLWSEAEKEGLDKFEKEKILKDILAAKLYDLLILMATLINQDPRHKLSNEDEQKINDQFLSLFSNLKKQLSSADPEANPQNDYLLKVTNRLYILKELFSTNSLNSDNLREIIFDLSPALVSFDFDF